MGSLSYTIVDFRIKRHPQIIPNALIVLESATGNQRFPMLQKDQHRLTVSYATERVLQICRINSTSKPTSFPRKEN